MYNSDIKNLALSGKVEYMYICILYDLAVLPLVIYTTEVCAHLDQKIEKNMFVAGQSVLDPKWEQCKCPSSVG